MIDPLGVFSIYLVSEPKIRSEWYSVDHRAEFSAGAIKRGGQADICRHNRNPLDGFDPGFGELNGEIDRKPAGADSASQQAVTSGDRMKDLPESG